MAVRAIRVALLLSSLPIVGCGTVVNVVRPGPAGGKTPFGGVRQDLDCIKQAANEGPGGRGYPRSDWEQCHQGARRLFCAADLPLTLLGDVVTWPYTATYSYI